MEIILKLYQLIIERVPIIYEVGLGKAQLFGALFSGGLILLAIYIRMTQLQIEQFHGKPKYSQFITEVFITCLVMTFYAFIVNYFSTLSNNLNIIGSKELGVASLQNNMDLLINKILKGNDLEKDAPSLLTNPGAWVPYGIYLLTLLAIMGLSALFEVAKALGLVVFYWFGFLALPLSIISGVKLLRGWLVWLGVFLLWPIVEGFFLLLFGHLFNDAVAVVIQSDGSWGDKQLALASAYLMFAVLNIIITGVIFAAPWVTYAFISNSGNVMSLVTPFAAAAIASAAAANAASKSTVNMGKSAVNKVKNIWSPPEMPEGSDEMKGSAGSGAGNSSHSNATESANTSKSSNNADNYNNTSSKKRRNISSKSQQYDDFESHESNNHTKSKGEFNSSEKVSPEVKKKKAIKDKRNAIIKNRMNDKGGKK